MVDFKSDGVAHLVGSLVLPFLIIGFMAFTNIFYSTVFMVVLAAVALGIHGKKAGDIAIIAALAFAMGFIADTGLNIMSSLSSGVRSQRLKFYFDVVGPVQAAAFAGMLTVWLVLPSYAIWLYLDGLYDGKLSRWWILLIGMAFGFFIGFFSQPTRALKPLLPFYRATSGWFENRLWDGISVVFALIPIVFFIKSPIEKLGDKTVTDTPSTDTPSTDAPTDSPSVPPSTDDSGDRTDEGDTEETSGTLLYVIIGSVGVAFIFAFLVGSYLRRTERKRLRDISAPSGFEFNGAEVVEKQAGETDFQKRLRSKIQETVERQQELERQKNLPLITIQFDGDEPFQVHAESGTEQVDYNRIYDDFPGPELKTYGDDEELDRQLDDLKFQEEGLRANLAQTKRKGTLEKLNSKDVSRFNAIKNLVRTDAQGIEKLIVENYKQVVSPQVLKEIDEFLKKEGKLELVEAELELEKQKKRVLTGIRKRGRKGKTLKINSEIKVQTYVPDEPGPIGDL